MQSNHAEALAAYAASQGWPYSPGETDEARNLLSRFSGFLRSRTKSLANPAPHLANVIKIGGEGDRIACDYVTYHERKEGSGEDATYKIVAVPHPVVMFGHNPGVPDFAYGPKSVGLRILQAFGLRRNDGNHAPRRLAAAGNILIGSDGPTMKAMFDHDSIAILAGVFGQRIESRSGGLLFYHTRPVARKYDNSLCVPGAGHP